jgi:hypothetical protein
MGQFPCDGRIRDESFESRGNARPRRESAICFVTPNDPTLSRTNPHATQ